MHDTMAGEPDLADLFQVAVGQQGYFTSRQAHDSGVSNDLIKHYVRTGSFIRAYRGVFRFRDYPPSPREHIAAAWLAVGKDHAVVSHESALDLLDLTDIIPYGIHFSVPRDKRYARSPSGVHLHTTTRELGRRDIRTVDGLKVTSPERTIVDVAEANVSPEHVNAAVAQALDRGVTTSGWLRDASVSRSQRVQRMIERAIDEAQA
jgi:predicted transcriptional regulator of viral defense system